MFQKTDIINRLAKEHFDVRLEDAAAEVGVPDKVEKVLYGAGFAKVEVRIGSLMLFQCFYNVFIHCLPVSSLHCQFLPCPLGMPWPRRMI